MSQPEQRDGEGAMAAALVAAVAVERFRDGRRSAHDDFVAIERPLAVKARLEGGEQTLVTTTMRTPGADQELAAGFLLAERVLHVPGDLRGCQQVDDDTVEVELAPAASTRLAAATRRFVTSSACGACGRDDIASLLPPSSRAAGTHRAPETLSRATVQRLPLRLREAQVVFAQTGGLHAAGLFDREGRLFALREDVGRHNALDKVVGAHVLAGRVALGEFLLVVSGRASFELVQKAAVARIPFLAAVGAPSSLAVKVAVEADMTLLGFLREDGFNVYHRSSHLEWKD